MIVAIVVPFTVTSYLIRALGAFASEKLFILNCCCNGGGGTSRLRRPLRLRELELRYRTGSDSVEIGRVNKLFTRCACANRLCVQ